MGKQRPCLAALMAVVGAGRALQGQAAALDVPWGATDDEITATLPGDELVAADTPRTTRAVTIDAPIAEVWPWLAQIGEGPRRLLQLLLAGTRSRRAHPQREHHPPRMAGHPRRRHRMAGPALRRGCAAGGGSGQAELAPGADVAR